MVKNQGKRERLLNEKADSGSVIRSLRHSLRPAGENYAERMVTRIPIGRGVNPKQLQCLNIQSRFLFGFPVMLRVQRTRRSR